MSNFFFHSVFSNWRSGRKVHRERFDLDETWRLADMGHEGAQMALQDMNAERPLHLRKFDADGFDHEALTYGIGEQ